MSTKPPLSLADLEWIAHYVFNDFTRPANEPKFTPYQHDGNDPFVIRDAEHETVQHLRFETLSEATACAAALNRLAEYNWP